MTFDIHVIVNSLNPTYYQDVMSWAQRPYRLTGKPPAVSVVQTPSNGYPGKGHNQVLLHYKKFCDTHDYCFMIDGDDAYYRTAFRQMYKALVADTDEPIDLIYLCINDRLQLDYTGDPHIYIPSINGYFCVLFDDINLWSVVLPANPWTTNLYKCRTPARILAFNKKIYETTPLISYDEECYLYDDYVPIIQAMVLHETGKLKTRYLTNSFIYLYNGIIVYCNCSRLSQINTSPTMQTPSSYDPDETRTYSSKTQSLAARTLHLVAPAIW
jgi:hypothetical protein